MHKYKLLGKKGEGTFSEVLKAQDIKSNKLVAIKCMKNHFDSVEQVNRLREIQALRRLSPHANIIKLHEVLYDRSTGRLALVFELMEMNIYELIRGRRQYLADDKVLHYMYQLMKGIDHMHRNGIFHRDIKPENILILNDALKLADFGSCRGIYSKQPFTEYISTRWYRAPECLLTDGYYNYKMDIWGVGCVFFEVMSLYPLFPGNNELDQIHKIHNIMGTPPAELLNRLKKHGTHMDFDFPVKQGTGITKLLPHATPEALDLMMKLLTYNPDERPSAKQALRHPYFKEIRELDKKLRKSKNGGGVDDDDCDAESHSTTMHSTTGLSTKPQDDDAPSDNSKLPPLPQGGGSLPALGHAKHTSTTSSMPVGNASVSQAMKGSQLGGGLPKVKEETKMLPKLVPIGGKK
jgi:renal tumor antigen